MKLNYPMRNNQMDNNEHSSVINVNAISND